jgi:hypothetical protein
LASLSLLSLLLPLDEPFFLAMGLVVAFLSSSDEDEEELEPEEEEDAMILG